MVNAELIVRLLESLNEYVDTLRPLQSLSLKELTSDTLKWNGLLHVLQVSVEHVTDICSHLLAGNGIAVPDHHRLMVLKAGQSGLLPPEFAERIAPMTGFRNIVVHHYLSVDPVRVEKILREHLADFEQFSAYVVDYLRREGHLPSGEKTE